MTWTPPASFPPITWTDPDGNTATVQWLLQTSRTFSVGNDQLVAVEYKAEDFPGHRSLAVGFVANTAFDYCSDALAWGMWAAAISFMAGSVLAGRTIPPYTDGYLGWQKDKAKRSSVYPVMGDLTPPPMPLGFTPNLRGAARSVLASIQPSEVPTTTARIPRTGAAYIPTG